jgi:hypothetical protein
VRFRFDLALRPQTHPRQVRAHDLAQSRLGQDEELVVVATQNDEGRDQPRLRREQQRRARLTARERTDVVRDHPLQIVRGVRPGDANEVPLSHSHLHAI